jgi:cell filamentation protein
VIGDPYIDPQTGVLHNRLGITDADELTRVESDLTVVQLVDLERRHLPGGYDLPHLQEFHWFLFGDIYDWAGELRTVTIAKADLFCLPENIASFSQDVFRALDRDGFLRGRERAEFVVGLAEHLANVNAVHPFREGNGRTQRAFFGQLARDAGYRIDWSTMDRGTNLAASRASIRGNEVQLRAMLDQLVDQPGE